MPPVCMWIFFTAVLLVPTRAAEDQKCDRDELDTCMATLFIMSQNQTLAFATTEEELTAVCNHLRRAVECVNNFTKRCLNEDQRGQYIRMSSGATSLIVDFCTSGTPFRKEYLQHALCYRSLQNEYKECAKVYMEEQKNKSKSDNYREEIQTSCCQFDNYRRCTKREVERKCSAEAAALVEQIILKAGGDLVKTHCSYYRSENNTCAGCSTTFSFTVLLLALLTHIFFRQGSTAG